MIATVAPPEFLPTDASLMDSPWAIACFLVAGLALIIGLVLMFSDLNFGFLAVIVAMCLVGLPYTVVAPSMTEDNRENMVKNVLMIYNVDHLTFDEIKAFSDSPTYDVTVTAGDKAFKAVLSEDPETFEPTLSAYNENVDMNELKKKF